MVEVLFIRDKSTKSALRAELDCVELNRVTVAILLLFGCRKWCLKEQ
jgi:hypothetical protein